MSHVRTSRMRRGFTLVELLLVMVILAVLAAVVVPKMIGRGEQARVTAAKQDIHQFEMQLDTFEVDNGRYPTNEEGLAALAVQPSGLTTWKGPYIKSQTGFKDPWGNAYVYRSPGTQNPNGVDIFSTGPGGKDSSGNDINNWSNSGTGAK